MDRSGGTEPLTSCLRDLISLLALPSLCHGRSLVGILELTLDSVATLMPIHLGYARLTENTDIEAFRLKPLRRGDTAADLRVVREVVEPRLRSPLPPPGGTLEGPFGMGQLRTVTIPIGFYADAGMLCLASREPDFPSTGDLVLVRAAASLAASAIESARAREGLEAARREAEAASRAKDEFLAMLGHELRNPLAPIVTALQLMQLRGDDSTARERIIIERQVAHLRQLVDDLLDVSRITEGRIELKRKRIELAEVVARAIELASPLLEQRKHHLALDCPPRGLGVDVDPGRCAQVVANLLTNAAKYTEPGGRIQITAKTREGRAVLRIRDDGIGITPEMLPRIFDLFVQDRQAIDRAEGGLGLGLAIVRSLVELHGGTVRADSGGAGQGSAFEIELPLAAARGEETEPGKPLSGPEVVSTGRRVLVVDDNHDAADLLAELLRSYGHVTRVAHDGAEALRVAKGFDPEIALLDLGLPVMDGYDLVRRLREIPGLEDLRTIAVTGYGQAGDRRRSAEAGFDAHLVKPVNIEQLRSLLTHVFD